MSSLAEPASSGRFHVGPVASGGYIGIWNLKNDLYVKRQVRVGVDENGDYRSYRVQYLSGGDDMMGFVGSIGGATALDVGKFLTLRADLYLSYRSSFVDATEHSYKILNLKDTTYSSKGKYEISLNYWHLDLPLAARLNLPSRFYVEGGAMISYIVAANLEMSLLDLDLNAYSSGAELAVLGAVGRGFMVKNRRLDVFGKFTFGFTPLLNDSVHNFIYQSVYLKEWFLELGAILWVF